MKETSLKRLRATGFQRRDVLKRQNGGDNENIQWLPGTGDGYE